ncbi:universal stress protein [Streptomyces capparidis]
MPEPVTAGVDGTPESLAAADWAAREALRRGLPLRLLHVVPEEGAGPGGDPLPQAAGELRSLYPGLPVGTRQAAGRPERVLAEVTEGGGTLVLGSRGLGAVTGFLLGSVGMHVLARAHGPVVLVRPGERAAVERPGEEVVVGVGELREAGGPVLGWAFEAARARGAAVRAVRAWNLPPVLGYDPLALRLLTEQGALDANERQALAEALLPWREGYPGVPVIEQVELGSASAALLRAATGADLVVVGRRSRHLGPRIGPVVHAVVHHAACPVAVVPHG